MSDQPKIGSGVDAEIKNSFYSSTRNGALGMPSPPTFKCYSTANVSTRRANSHRGDLISSNKYARAVATAVSQCYYEDIALSDHWPVQAIYTRLNEVDRRHTIARAAAILPALKWSISTLRCALVLNGLTFLAEMHKASVHAAEFAVQRPYTYRFPWFR
jgi:hypothetical protein